MTDIRFLTTIFVFCEKVFTIIALILLILGAVGAGYFTLSVIKSPGQDINDNAGKYMSNMQLVEADLVINLNTYDHKLISLMISIVSN